MKFLEKILGKTAATSAGAEPHGARMPSCMERLRNMREAGFSPDAIFDCGASVGHWSWEACKLFPDAEIVAIEPNPLVTPKTRELFSSRAAGKMHVVECAVGSSPGVAHLNVWDNEETKMSGSSLKSHVQGDPRQKVEVEVRTIDQIAESFDFAPGLIKLDLQGYELEALKGCKQLLETTEAFIIEFGCLEAYIDRATPMDLMKVMYDNDYCLYDIVDLIYRPYDKALTGGDFFFVKNTSSLKSHKGYR